MKTLDYLTEALSDLSHAKLRTALTSLGIVIGVASVVLLVSLGEGVKNSVANTFSDLGAQRVMIIPSNPGGGGASGPALSTLNMKDVELISDTPEIAAMAPVTGFPVQVQTESEPISLTVLGTTEEYLEINSDVLIAGKVFSAGNNEVVVNEHLAKSIFGSSVDAVGKKISFAQRDFEISGIIENKQLQGSFSPTDAEPAPVMIGPLDVVEELSGTNILSQIILNVTPGEDIEQTTEQIEDKLLESRDGLKDFRVFSFKELAEQFSSITDILTSFLSAIAAISLLVGGVGIMNIMLVVVSERTKEIGIAKAIGANRSTIVAQFLIEAIVLSLLGGIIGLILAWGAAELVSVVLEVEAIISLSTILLALGVSSFIGILFGVAPAWRAARLDPIVALRHE